MVGFDGELMEVQSFGPTAGMSVGRLKMNSGLARLDFTAERGFILHANDVGRAR